MLISKIRKIINNERGEALLISVIMTTMIVAAIGYSVLRINTAANIGSVGATMAQHSRWFVESKINEVNNTPYSSLPSIAESRTVIPGTEYEREVIVGEERSRLGGAKERDVTVNVYKKGSNIVLSSLNLTTSNISDSASQPHGQQIFYSNGTFIVPDNIFKIWVTVCAAGGDWGSWSTDSQSNDWDWAPGGDGGSVVDAEINVTPGQAIPVSVGEYKHLGKGKYADPNSSFGSYIVCTGGQTGSEYNGTINGKATQNNVAVKGIEGAGYFGAGRGGYITGKNRYSHYTSIAPTAGVVIVKW